MRVTHISKREVRIRKTCRYVYLCVAGEGVRELLQLAESQLQEGSLDGFPDVDSDLMWHKTDEDCQATAKDIVKVMMTLDPHYFAIYLC